MPRQPLNRVLPPAKLSSLLFGIESCTSRPGLTAIIGECLTLWTYVEAEVATVLGTLLKAENAATLAVFQVLRRSSSQYEAISEAAKHTIHEKNVELLGAVLNVHKATETERNALAHGHFGACDALPNAILWMHTNDIVKLRVRFHLDDTFDYNEAEIADQVAKTFVYRENDLTKLRNEIKELWYIWFDLREHLHMFASDDPSTVDDEAYLRLCGRSRVAQELEKLHRRNTPSIQPPSHPQDQSETQKKPPQSAER
jgi:hypothetical protein